MSSMPPTNFTMIEADGLARGDISGGCETVSEQVARRVSGEGNRSVWVPGGPTSGPGRDPAPSASSCYRFTFGHYTQSGPWDGARSLTWPDLCQALTTHAVGAKTGTCLVPATFRGTRRHQADADQIDVAFLDSDAGATRDEIEAAVRARGWAAIISSTHSHLSSRTTTTAAVWRKFLDTCDDPVGAAAAFLVKRKGYLSRVAEGAHIVEETGDDVTFEHQPCPKFRIAIPLLRPWRAGDYADQQTANSAWRQRIEALAAALRLDHDQACTDTSRLFYLPRRPANGPPAETAIIEGEACDLFSLPDAPAVSSDQQRLRQSDGGPAPEADAFTYTDQTSSEVINLRDWAREHAGRFEIVTALQARRPSAFVGKISDNTRHHLRCVNESAHTQAGADTATFIVNAGSSTSQGFVYHCRHAHCDGVDRLVFLHKMLEQGWLTIADLTDPTFLTVADPDDPDEPDTTRRRALSIGSDAEIAGRVAKDLARKLGQIVHDEGAFWSHNGQHWEVVAEDVLWRAVFTYDGASFHTPAGEPANVKLNKTRVTSVLACMVPLLIEPRFFANAAIGINCASGFITFAPDGTPALVPHRRDHRHRHVIAGRWPREHPAEVKKASLLHRLLDGCFRDDADKKQKIDLLAEIGGTAALGRATRVTQPKAIVCHGKHAENGKSQILALLRSQLPKSAVSAISPGRFDDRTFVCHLVGKLLNAPDELAGTDAIASEAFKQIITGEPLMVRDVYRSAFEFEPRAQHVFATNTLPTFKGGMDRGVRRRLMVLTFNRVIPKAERVERIGQRIGEEEADLLLDWAVRGASRVIASQGFTLPPSSATALLDWMYASDPVLAWLESDEVSFTTGDGAAETSVSIAHLVFLRWAREQGFEVKRLPAVNGFSQRVEASDKGITKRRVSGGVLFVGLTCSGVRPSREPEGGGS